MNNLEKVVHKASGALFARAHSTAVLVKRAAKDALAGFVENVRLERVFRSRSGAVSAATKAALNGNRDRAAEICRKVWRATVLYAGVHSSPSIIHLSENSDRRSQRSGDART